MTGLAGADFLRLDTPDVDDLEAILDGAERLKRHDAPQPLLADVQLGMIFQKRSTRTRVSFEAGIDRLGGNAVFLSADDIQLGRGETIGDTARALSRYCDALMARVYDHGDVEELAAHADVPVVNGLSDFNHPCQGIADLFTIRQVHGDVETATVAWLGDGNNVCHSLLHGASRFGATVRVATPERHGPDGDVVERAEGFAEKAGGAVSVGHDPEAAVEGADVVYTDSWVSMGDDEKDEAVFEPFRVDEAMLAGAADDVAFMHCLPAHRGEEVTDAVMDGPHSVVWQQAENRMHAQNALLTLVLGRNA